METLFPAFLDEARLLLDRLERSVRSLAHTYSPDEFESAFRSLHTLKSSTRTVGLSDLGALIHEIETRWESERATNGSKDLYDQTLRVALALSDAIKSDMLQGGDVVEKIRSAWEGKSLFNESPLSIPQDVHLSSKLYERLVGATESVLTAKTKMEVLGGTLLRSADKVGKSENTMKDEYVNASELLRRATGDLEASLRDARMTPLSVFFDRLPLLVTDVAAQLKKDISLVISGGELQADRLVISELGGALAHLVKNAIDHGIDMNGEVKITARQEHDHLFVAVEDDGKGISYDALVDIAREKGIIQPSTTVTWEMKQDLLFHPHISTSGRTTEISGRGVGMSAVREYARSVGGSVLVETPSSGRGTRVTLRIPTTLTLVRILLVRAGHATFGIPVTDLRGTVKFDPAYVYEEHGRKMVWLGERSTPFLPLSQMLRLSGGYHKKGIPLSLHLDTGNGGVALLVDAVLQEEEVLVKALPKILSSLVAFRGAAMVGDGRTMLVLDGGGLTRMPVPEDAPTLGSHQRLTDMERDELMEIMNMVASHAGGALARRFGTHIELSVPECADGVESLPEEDWGASSIGVRMSMEGEYPGNLLFEMPATLSGRLTALLRSKKADLHALSSEERAFFQEIGQIAMHAVGNMLSKISKHPVMTKMSDIRVDARGALRTYFLSAHQGSPEELVRVRLWFGVGEGIRTDDHRETGSLTMELHREDAKKLLQSSQALA